MQIRYDDEDEDEGPQPDPTLEQGVPIPVRLQGGFPPELASTPLEDIDTFYANQLVSQHFFNLPKTNKKKIKVFLNDSLLSRKNVRKRKIN